MNQKINTSARILLALMLILISQISFSQAPSWIWGKPIQELNCEITDVCVGQDGHIYVAGYYNGFSLIFNNTLINNNNPGHTGTDFFLLKFNKNGEMIWARGSESYSYGYISDIQTDKFNNIYISGDFEGEFESNPFLIKFNQEGEILKIYKPDNGEWLIKSISVNDFGEVHTIGRVSDSVSFDTFNVKCPNYVELYCIVSYDANGTVDNVGSFKQDYFLSSDNLLFRNDNQGNLFVTGEFHGSLRIDTFHYESSQFINDSYLAKLNNSGNLLWIKIIEGPGTETIDKLHINPGTGISIISGSFCSPSLVFDTIQIIKKDPHITEQFFVQYNSDGQVIWATIIEREFEKSANFIATDNDDNYYMTGSFSEEKLSFGSIEIINTNYPGDCNYLVKCSSSREVIWAIELNGNYKFNAFAVGPNNEFIIGGLMKKETYLSPIIVIEPGMFIAKMTENKLSLNGIETGNDNLIIYPNPSRDGIFNLELPLNTKLSNFEIYDNTGKMIYSKNIKGDAFNPFTVNLSQEAAGIFYLKVSFENGMKINKKLLYVSE